MTVTSDGAVFLANGGGGLRAYDYNGASLISTAHVNDGGDAQNMAISPEGTVFLANATGGLRAYAYDGASLTSTATIHDGGYAMDIAISKDGSLFLANEDAGLWAYTYDGTSFTHTANYNDDYFATGVAVSQDGTVFLADFHEGLFAYTYSVSSAVEGDPVFVPSECSLENNHPNPFNPSTTICYSLENPARVTLTLYDALGKEIQTLVHSYHEAGHYSVRLNTQGIPSGVYFYEIQAGNFRAAKKMVKIE